MSNLHCLLGVSRTAVPPSDSSNAVLAFVPVFEEIYGEVLLQMSDNFLYRDFFSCLRDIGVI